MDLYLGGAYQGKLQLALRECGLQMEDVFDGEKEKIEKAKEKKVLYHVTALVRQLYEAGEDPQKWILVYITENPDAVIVAEETGCGIIPMDVQERTLRECTGRMLCELAKRADTVTRVFCGLPMRVKGIPLGPVLLLRHGETRGNLERRYIGATDESLCPEGKAKLEVLPWRSSPRILSIFCGEESARGEESACGEDNACREDNACGEDNACSEVFVTCKVRTKETANLLFPAAETKIVSGLEETDFGEFENHSHNELCKLKSYQQWISGEKPEMIHAPEEQQAFVARCRNAFASWCEGRTSCAPAVFVVHGGTIMALLSELAVESGDFYSYQVENGHGYLCRAFRGEDKNWHLRIMSRL